MIEPSMWQQVIANGTAGMLLILAGLGRHRCRPRVLDASGALRRAARLGFPE
jgi:hypothetical protein